MKSIEEIIKTTNSRDDLWSEFINNYQLKNIVEIGVYIGEFAKIILRSSKCIEKYYMIDPWKNLENWNKPSNVKTSMFESFYQKTMDKTEFAKEKRIVLRGKTTEVIDEINDNSIDFAYIDGDHTLKGITIDLIKVYPKIKYGGWIAGDDLCKSIWQHNKKYEPTLVFPFVLYFAEAMSLKIFALPYNQFLIHKEISDYKFIDMINKYNNINLRDQLNDISI